jgi:chemotaxis protein MotB
VSHAEADDAKHHEIVIVRHGHGDHDDGHHGGAWKIAFADFMTAMMCFFLVMWLINAANEETKVAVASYFNPVKLVDRNASRKGSKEVGDGRGRQAAQEKAEKIRRGGLPESTNEGTSRPSQVDGCRRSSLPILCGARRNRRRYGQAAEHQHRGAGGAQAAGPATGASGGGPIATVHRTSGPSRYRRRRAKRKPAQEIPSRVERDLRGDGAAMAPADDPFSSRNQ